ncbi:MAG: transporter, partial [Rhizobium oryzihabitans]
MDLITPVIPGLVWAYHFQPGKAPCRRLAPDAGLEEMSECDGFFWLHLNLADQRVANFLETIEGLDPAARA